MLSKKFSKNCQLFIVFDVYSDGGIPNKSLLYTLIYLRAGMGSKKGKRVQMRI